jgi:hypothetical protein
LNRIGTKIRICASIALSAIMRVSAAAPEPKAVEIARAMMQAMGGEAAWKQARYVRFDFIVKIHGQARIARAPVGQADRPLSPG